MQGLSLRMVMAVVLIASAIDLKDRRIPNWLSIPFLAAGLMVQMIYGRLHGVEEALLGIGLASLLFGVPWFLGGMGAGDVKLAAGVAAWLGPGQFFLAAIFTAVAGGLMAVVWGMWAGSFAAKSQGGGSLTACAPHGERGATQARMEKARAGSIPYAPAIAIGALFSFLAQ